MCASSVRETAAWALGKVRVAAAGTLHTTFDSYFPLTLLSELLQKRGQLKLDPSQFNFLWVDDFPLFDVTDTGELVSNHHPFTAPLPADVALLKTEPLKVRGLHYDVVLNGIELGGGSVRVHDPNLQV